MSDLKKVGWACLGYLASWGITGLVTWVYIEKLF